ncbi:MAG: hypothetical protein RLZZ09_1199, partial [Pseudomonadota bacterium]
MITIADDKVIQHPDIHQIQRLLEPLSDEAVSLAGFGNAGGMIVGEDDGRRIVGQRSFDHFAGIHASAVDGAAEQFAKLDHPVLIVQQQAGEYLMGVGAHLGSEVLAGQFRA